MTDFKEDWINNNRAIAIIGVADSGKTNLAFYFAKMNKQEKKYLLGYPKKMDGFISLNSTEDLSKITEGLLIIDEFSRYFPVWERKSNASLLNLLRFAEHNQIKLILTTTLSQFITKQCEALIPCWAIKQINIRRLKNGSTPSYVLKYAIKHPNISTDFMKVAVNEFVWFNENGKQGKMASMNFQICLLKRIGKSPTKIERKTAMKMRKRIINGRKMVKINDVQNQAIWDAISKEHSKLSEMYNQRKNLEERQERELNDYTRDIADQEVKVQNLCQGKVKYYVNENNKLILDLSDKDDK